VRETNRERERERERERGVPKGGGLVDQLSVDALPPSRFRVSDSCFWVWGVGYRGQGFVDVLPPWVRVSGFGSRGSRCRLPG